ncbi:hypothetical protein ACHAQJ_002202 [Trichoderma viride]
MGPPPPPGDLPPTGNGEYVPPQVPCSSLGDPIVIPPGFNPDLSQPQDGPGEASNSDFEPPTTTPPPTPTSSKGVKRSFVHAFDYADPKSVWNTW